MIKTFCSFSTRLKTLHRKFDRLASSLITQTSSTLSCRSIGNASFEFTLSTPYLVAEAIMSCTFCSGDVGFSAKDENFKLLVAYEFLFLTHHCFEILSYRHREVEQDKQTTRSKTMPQPKASHRDPSSLQKMYS